ncbi:MAG: hypothetical protein ACI9UJ_000148 [bacterium]
MEKLFEGRHSRIIRVIKTINTKDMKQSELMNRLGLGAAGVVLPTGLARVKNEPVRVYNGFLQSIMHYGFVDLKERFKTGDALSMERDFDNAYDVYAVGVYWKGVKIGYLASTENIVIANLLDSGISMQVYIGKVDLQANPQHALSVVIFTDVVIALPAVSSKFSPKPPTEMRRVYQSA